MESLKFEVAPPAPRLNITATYDDIQKSPQLYFQVRYYYPCFTSRCGILVKESANTLAHRALTSFGCSSHRVWSC